MSEQNPLVVAVDLGGTRIRAALVGIDGHFVRRLECPTEAAAGSEAVVERIVTLVEDVLQEVSTANCLGVGVSTVGPLDVVSGQVLSPPNLPGWQQVPLRSILQDRLAMPVALVNDGNAAALGEWAFGAGQGYQNLIYITISTGVGGGIIAGGQLFLGHRGLSGEIGHMTLQANGPRCNCGNQGCWEALASGTAIAREGAEAVRENRSPLLHELCHGVAGEVDARLVGEAARRGDPAAQGIVAQAAYYSGTGTASLLHLFSPEIVLIGGGVSQLGDLLLEPLRRATRERVMPAYRDIPIRLAALGGDAGLLGSAALFLNRRNDVKKNPFTPEALARIRQQVLQAYPEMEGAEMTVQARRRSAQEVAAAMKLGLPVPKEEEEPRYTIILRKDVPAEDGVIIPLTVHVTVDAEGHIVKSREGR